ncbi:MULTISPECIES: NAD(P)H-dependent oxidoreductase subunit E [unclassified Fusibacter]|uniref:NADH-quinone oxidoreductase subunit NuoE family protein n=1 Tax=unclassified Fusibacter TaxID=2624464 RepID=UPI0010137521|nr:MULTISPECIES: NAD(P)H-dependent oxidoreductase subunit E [unclassified Fusibacter]MCK8058277.1 NAD(P)H-dependent oxidoreductase subunit E [Fusibacter sp. A2]NPE20860.1 NAD(P)H-dependent oxidoreductase subunit E [Fusibacter sp. A1]RXV63064.1 NAD(P)H-dependent oxidoreductase subunit E [Fusibacter sp. A1]
MSKSAAQTAPISVKDISQDIYDQLQAYIDGLETKEGAVIHCLHKAQELIGYLPKEVMLFISRGLNLPAAEVFGVVSFYSYFSTQPTGEHKISVCMGTACYVKGSEKVLEEFKKQLGLESAGTTPDMQFTLKDVRCVGACGLAPILTVGDKVYGHVSVDDVAAIVAEYKKEA